MSLANTANPTRSKVLYFKLKSRCWDESTFVADGKLVLVHQLIRQYVTATILLQLVGDRKEVIPFVVGDNTDYLKKTSQVRFMIDQCWLRQTNILDWEDIKRAQTA